MGADYLSLSVLTELKNHGSRVSLLGGGFLFIARFGAVTFQTVSMFNHLFFLFPRGVGQGARIFNLI